MTAPLAAGGKTCPSLSETWWNNTIIPVITTFIGRLGHADICLFVSLSAQQVHVCMKQFRMEFVMKAAAALDD